MDREQLTEFLAPTWYSLGGTLVLALFGTAVWVMRNTYSLGGGRAYPFPGDVTWTVISVLLLWPFTLAEYLLIHTALGGYIKPVAVAVNITYLYVVSTAFVHGIRRYRS